jgi:hypothetical protein
MRQYKNVVKMLVLGVVIALSSGGVAHAVQSSSSHYGVDETFFGSGGELNACSTNYCSKQTAGETVVGSSNSANFGIQGGNSDRDNSLEMLVTGANLNLGQLTTTSTKVAESHFSVKSYLASGYAVRTVSPGPKYSSHVLQLLTTGAGSSTGTEQFGINLVANSCPANTSPSGPGACSGGLGTDPQEVPDTSFSFGHAAPGYDTADTYKYNNGDTIAYSNSSSGETDYTISYLMNISAITPAGTYTMNHVLVATSTF